MNYDIIGNRKEKGMKKKIHIYCLCAIVIFVSVFACHTTPTFAAGSKNKRACKAYAKAIANNKIKIPTKYADGSSMNLGYALADINQDGIKDLVLLQGDCDISAWTYQNGRVVKLLKKYSVAPTDRIYCDAKHNRYWIPGEGDGGGYLGCKLKKGRFVPAVSYYIGWKSNNKMYATKTVRGKTRKISVAKYRKIAKAIERNKCVKFKHVTKKKLITILKQG